MNTLSGEAPAEQIAIDDKYLVPGRLAVAGTFIKASPEIARQTSIFLFQEALARTVGAGIKRIVLGKPPK